MTLAIETLLLCLVSPFAAYVPPLRASQVDQSRRLGLRLNVRRCVSSSPAAFASESSKISEFGKPSIRAKWGHHDALKDHQLEASKCSGEADGGERKLTEGALHAQPRVAS